MPALELETPVVKRLENHRDYLDNLFIEAELKGKGEECWERLGPIAKTLLRLKARIIPYTLIRDKQIAYELARIDQWVGTL